MSDKPSWNFDREETMRQLGADPESWRSFAPKPTVADKRDNRDPETDDSIRLDVINQRTQRSHMDARNGEAPVRTDSEDWRAFMERQRHETQIMVTKNRTTVL